MKVISVILFIKIYSFTSAETFLQTFKVECEKGNNSKYVDNLRCQLQPIERGVNAITILVDVVYTVNAMSILVKLSRKSPSSESYDNIIINDTFDYCNNAKNSAALKLVLPIFNKYAPSLIHECPYEPQKDFGFKNLVIDAKLFPSATFSALPRGDYCILTAFYDKNNNLMGTVKAYSRIAQRRPTTTTKRSG